MTKKTYFEKTKARSEKSKSYADKPKTYSEKPKSYTEKSKDYADKPKAYAENAKSYADRPKAYAEKPRSYFEKPQLATSGRKPDLELFKAPSPAERAANADFFDKLPAALAAALPMKSAHLRDLPMAVADLSRMLTGERAALGAKPYWASPRLAAAYLHYFLPWNIIRLRALFAGLNLPAPVVAQAASGGYGKGQPDAASSQTEHVERPALLDIGSGPLSVPLALWLAYPAWREIPLDFICLDASTRPLDLGRTIFTAITGPDCRWRIFTRRSGLDSLRRSERGERGRYQYIFSANVLNEWMSARHKNTDPDGTGTVGERLGALLEDLGEMIMPGGSMLFVEPGTRLGGKTISGLREAALEPDFEDAFTPSAPCGHVSHCPMAQGNSWCHFTFKPYFVPKQLDDLSDRAGLPKQALSLSFVLLRTGRVNLEKNMARIISAPFAVPGIYGMARYACTARGLALLENAESLPSGSLLKVNFPENPRRDRKSGAMII